MKLYHLSTGPLKVNTYFLVNENNQAIVIDSGENYNLITKTAKENGFKLEYALYTHGHFDHAGNAKKLQDNGVKIVISKIDAKKLSNDDNLSKHFGRNFDYLTPDVAFYDGEVLNLCGIEIKALITPGHTDGSACFIVENNIFSGDTLFLESVGRTDFPSGNRDMLVKSVKRLFALQGEYNVLPGHDDFTTLSHEREFNILNEYD